MLHSIRQDKKTKLERQKNREENILEETCFVSLEDNFINKRVFLFSIK